MFRIKKLKEDLSTSEKMDDIKKQKKLKILKK